MFLIVIFILDFYKEINPTTVFILKAVYSTINVFNT